MSHTMEALLGDSVHSATGQSVPVRSLCGKERVLGLYFTAQWSPPCRMFTPTLLSFYESVRSGTLSCKDQLEIVQISWDKDLEGYNEATHTMPWLALPFEHKDRQRKLSRKLGVHGIPRLVLLDGETGRVITRDGFDRLSEDSKGSGFPWRRKSLRDVIKGPLLQPSDDGEVLQEVEATSAIANHDVIGFYFSAHWCLPCRHFDLELARAYHDLRSRGVKFQVVLVSADRSPEAFTRHVSKLPWPTLPFDDPRHQTMKKHLEVDGIPMLVLVDSQGNTITMNGRQALTQDPQCLEFPWYPQPVEDLTPITSVQLNERVSVIMFTDGSEAAVSQARNVLREVATSEMEKGELRDLYFFVAGEDEFSDNVRDFADLDDTCPLLIILDSPEQQVYTFDPEVKVTRQAVTQFVGSYLKGELVPTPIPPLIEQGVPEPVSETAQPVV